MSNNVPSRGGHETPELRHLGSDDKRALIISLRYAVAPILANNIFNHFTDHTVTHSDNVTHIVDALISPLQRTISRLSDDELVVLYSACYLHDIGMQYENAGGTEVIQGLQLQIPWEELDEGSRRDHLRRYHHCISAELVAGSVRTLRPPIGIQLTDAYRPTQVACLCEGHCVTPGTDRYGTLMAPVPNLRMPLLSGLLRLADILDESRRRAYREKANTLLLDLEAQKHWWRHYYTTDVTFEPDSRTITVWFEFPTGRVDEFQRVVPELQLPWVESELDHHRAAFTQAGLGWTLMTRTVAGTNYSAVEEMPDSVFAEMLKELRRRQLLLEEEARQVALQTFKEARPLIERRLASLIAEKASLPISEYVDRLAHVANDLWDIGSWRSAWMALAFEFQNSYRQLDVPRRVRIGSRLLQMMIRDGATGHPRGWIGELAVDVDAMPQAEPAKFEAQRAIAEWFVEVCAYEQAVDALRKAAGSTANRTDVRGMEAQMLEMHFLQGELEKLVSGFPQIRVS